MTTCTVTVFGRRLADLPIADANYFRGILARTDDCEDCLAYQEAHALDTLWRTQRNRLHVFDTVGPEEDYS